MTLSDLARFWEYSAKLKRLERRGWRKLGLKRVESVADHSFALALIALFEAQVRKYDLEKVLKLALIHDLEEAITGDLTPADKRLLGASRVRRAREAAIRNLLVVLPPNSRRSFRMLWDDLKLLRTKEAQLVHELDKFEMALQANEYSRTVGRSRVEDFFESASKEINDPKIAKELRRVFRDSS